MIDDSYWHDAESRSDKDDSQQAVEVCEHAAYALRNGDLSRAHALLDEARAAVERAQHDESSQAYRETAYDCYD